jgi:gliding motility-associated-like protein
MSNFKLLLVLMLLFFVNLVQAKSQKSVQQYIRHSDWNFKENKGQLRDPSGNRLPEIKYYGQQGGVHIYCKPGAISFVFTKTESDKNISEATGSTINSNTKSTGINLQTTINPVRTDVHPGGEQRLTISATRIDLILFNSNHSAPILASDPLESFENFYTTGDADQGITHVKTYNTITYKSIYHNIDLVLHARENGMKYEFVVYPGGRVRDIQMQWNGLQKMKIAGNGSIEYANASAKMIESAPYTFIADDAQFYPASGKTSKIGSRFLQDKNVVGFKVNRYDKSKVLEIDPTLNWGTYFGGKINDEGNAVATDVSGNVYITGATSSTSGIATSGAYQTSLNGYEGVFVAKFNGNGKIQWATYYNGDRSDQGWAIAVDGAGSIYVTGITTSSAGIATSGAYITTYGGNRDAYLAKFSNNGYLQWATYFGGSGDESGYGITTDISGDICITGLTFSASGIATAGAYKSVYDSGQYAYLAKFKNNGQILWATYYGGGKQDMANSVSTDPSGNVFIYGNTQSTKDIATAGAYQTSFAGGAPHGDGFLAKFNAAGVLQWGTYYGGKDDDWGQSCSTDGSGNVFITGVTKSVSGIATPGAYQTFAGSGYSAYLGKFTANGALQWATYYAGNYWAETFGVATDASGNAFIGGYTASTVGIATNGAYQTSLGGLSGINNYFNNTCPFFAEFNRNGVRMWATYYGETDYNRTNAVATDHFGNIFFTGQTLSDSGMETSGAYQTYNAGSYDAFLVKLSVRPDTIDAGIDSFISLSGNYCTDTIPISVRLKNYGINELDSVNIFFSVNGKIQPPYLWKGKLKTDSTAVIPFGKIVFPPGKDTLKTWTHHPDGVNDSFPGNDTAITTVTIYPLPAANAGPDTILCYNEVYTMQGSGGITYVWHPATFLSSATNPNAKAILPNTQQYMLVVTNAIGCQDSSPVLLKVRPRLKVKAFALNNPVCAGQRAGLYAKGSGGDSLHYQFQWVDDAQSGDTMNKKLYVSGWHKVILSDNCTPLSAVDSVFVTVIPPPKAAFTMVPFTKVKVNKEVKFTNRSTNALHYLWTFNSHDSSKMVSPTHIYTDSGDYKIRLVAYGTVPCPNDTAYQVIQVSGEKITIYIPNSFTPNDDGKNEFFDISGSGISSYTYSIYNRWGENIFNSTTTHPGWDGTFKGQPVMEGVYIYQLDVTDITGEHHYLSGNVTLLR